MLGGIAVAFLSGLLTMLAVILIVWGIISNIKQVKQTLDSLSSALLQCGGQRANTYCGASDVFMYSKDA